MSFFKWSKTAANNATADGTINFAEGQSPSSLNDSCRAEMAAAAKWRDDIEGGIVTTGTSTAFVVASNQAFDTLANMSGHMVAFVPHATNTGTCTLNVDSLGAKALRSAPSVELVAGDLVAGTPYVATYFNATTEWIIHGAGAMPTYVPLGAMMDFTGSAAPNSRFVLPYGQAISRTTYAAYFALVSTTYGTGDGSTTFNVPDLRGRVVACLDNLGTGAAGRLTGATQGAALGGETVTIARAGLPNVTLSVTGTVTPTANGGSSLLAIPGGASAFDLLNGSGIPIAVYRTSAFANADTVNLASGATSSINGNTSQTATSIVQPTIALTKILRVL